MRVLKFSNMNINRYTKTPLVKLLCHLHQILLLGIACVASPPKINFRYFGAKLCKTRTPWENETKIASFLHIAVMPLNSKAGEAPETSVYSIGVGSSNPRKYEVLTTVVSQRWHAEMWPSKGRSWLCHVVTCKHSGCTVFDGRCLFKSFWLSNTDSSFLMWQERCRNLLLRCIIRTADLSLATVVVVSFLFFLCSSSPAVLYLQIWWQFPATCVLCCCRTGAIRCWCYLKEKLWAKNVMSYN